MLLDIGLGIIGAIIFSHAVEVKLSFDILATSLFFALLPDVDFILSWAKVRRLSNIDHKHRDLLHYPLISLPAGFLAIAYFNYQYAWLFVALSLLHFIHDSIGIGWGVLWLYPFSKKYYKFFSEKNGKFSSKLVASWTDAEQDIASTQFGDKNWLKNIYFKLHPISLIELLFFVFALILLLKQR